jgi:RNA polymerase sigma-70 factor, ECF subfamily
VNQTTDIALAFLAEHGPRLHAILLRLTLRGDVAEDLMQDLFCKLVENQRFVTAASPIAYATRMATNLAFDYRRSQQRTRRAESVIDPVRVSETSPIADLVRREELDRVLGALGRLPRDSRDILVLRYLQQHDYETIGREFGKTPQQLRARCHKALVRLRRLLDDAPKPISIFRGRSK